MAIRDQATVEFEGYTLERELGRGGMGVVFEAVQISLQRRVALKALRPELASDPEFVERFRREGRLQASIEHPHVLDVYEVGGSPPDGLFLAMRLVRGPTLADLLRSGELDAERALHLLGQVAGALDTAHGAGLLHRDVKPQNILVDEGDHAFLADFGISRAGTEAVTASRPMIGTMAYVAPEVVHGEAPGFASDRYAFAATLFHCLTGDAVFPRGSDAAVLYAHATEPPPRISDRRAGLPQALDRVFERALAKDPAMRPATAQELIEDVRESLDATALARLGAAGLATGREPPGAPGPPLRPGDPPPRSRGRRIGALVAVVVAAAALGAGTMALLRADEEPAEVAAADEVPVPAIPEGAQPLGSDLGLPDDSLDCRGNPASSNPVSCSIVQTGLPGAQILVPADGEIVGWSVRGASGEMALDVIRPGGDATIRVGRSQWESAGNAASHRFPASLPVERGDMLGVELGPGARVGIGRTEDATTERWFSPLGGGYGSPDREPGTGFDYEVLVRADFVPGAEVSGPRTLTGAQALSAAEGLVRKRVEVEISEPPTVVNVELVEVGDRVALDLLRGERRMARTFVPDLLPGGQPIEIEPFTYEGEGVSEVAVWWVNPSSGRMIFHFFTVSRRQIQFVG